MGDGMPMPGMMALAPHACRAMQISCMLHDDLLTDDAEKVMMDDWHLIDCRYNAFADFYHSWNDI